MNILFFEKDEMKFVLDLEKQLNIELEFANSIDSFSVYDQSSDDEQLGPFMQKLSK